MNNLQVIGIVIGTFFISTALCDPPKANVDPKCLAPPPSDVDPMTCCKIPELLDPKLIDTCARKVYGPPTTPLQNGNANEPPFAPQIRVSLMSLA